MTILQSVVLFVLLGALPLFSQETLPLTLNEAVLMALRPQAQQRLRKAQLERELAETQLVQARSTMALHVDGTITESMFRFDLRSLGLDLPQTSPFVVNVNLSPVVGPFSVLDSRISATRPLLDPAAAGQIRAAKSNADTAKSQESGLKEQLAAEAAGAYLEALLAGATVQAAVDAVTQAEFFVRIEQERKAQGLVTGSEVRRATLQLSESQQKAATAKASERLSLLRLKAVSGIDFARNLTLASLPDPKNRISSPNEAVAAALASHPQLNFHRSRLHALDIAGKAIDAQKLPTLTAFGNFGGLTIAPTPNRTDNAALSHTYTAGVALRIPVLDGGRRAAQIAEVDVRRREIDSAVRQLRQHIELQVRLAFEKLHGSEEQLALLAQKLQLHDEEVFAVEARYQAGEASGVELREAQGRQSRGRFERLLAVHEWNLARLALAEATGTVLEFNW